MADKLIELFLIAGAIIMSGYIFPLILRWLNNSSWRAWEAYSSLYYLFNGADVIENGYRRSKGQPFTINTPGRKHHIVSTKNLIDEINKAPVDVLSLHAVAKDFLQPKHTMQGFEWKNVRGAEGTGFVRALRHILTSKLPDMLPTLRSHITAELKAQLLKHEVELGSYRLPLYDTAKTLVAKINCLVFFGPELTANEEFLRAATAFPHECALAAEIIRFLPCKLSRWFAARVTGNYEAASSFHRQLSREVSQRMDGFRSENQVNNNNKRKNSAESTEWNDGLQWLIETSPSKQVWDVDRMVGEVMGIWYGSAHTLGIGVTYALLDLYARPEYVEMIRSEIRNIPSESLSGQIDDLPILDAFLKESARLSAFESTAVRRQALKPWTFTTGLSVQPGDWICVPTRSLMRDAARFPDPLRFNISRHFSTTSSSGRDQTGQRLLVDSNKDNDGTLIWGLSRISCPGRFYASMVMKLVVATFLDRYECELPEQCGARSLQWRSSIIPRSNVTLYVRDIRYGAAKASK